MTCLIWGGLEANNIILPTVTHKCKTIIFFKLRALKGLITDNIPKSRETAGLIWAPLFIAGIADCMENSHRRRANSSRDNECTEAPQCYLGALFFLGFHNSWDLII